QSSGASRCARFDPFQAFKVFERMARQDDEKQRQELEEKLQKKEEEEAAAPPCPAELPTRQEQFQTNPDSYNGAVRENYAWSQDYSDLEIKVPVPKHIVKGKQVAVDISSGAIRVAVLEGGSPRVLMEGKLTHKINRAALAAAPASRRKPGAAVFEHYLIKEKLNLEKERNCSRGTTPKGQVQEWIPRISQGDDVHEIPNSGGGWEARAGGARPGAFRSVPGRRGEPSRRLRAEPAPACLKLARAQGCEDLQLAANILMVSLSKGDEYWWNAVLEGEERIDIDKINKERSMATVDEEEAGVGDTILGPNQALPLASPQKVHEMLKKGWDTEGSPFRGQKFDPSMFNISPGAVQF
ncbi:PREDICTED: nudC domain-containing protein 3, partial [Tinamus guttatus]|uniref:nudC domain-containing protein 3 n=1 Tax=Tinamus guttatus TaxID=94827 RepID=UPI00052ED77B